MVVSNNEMLYGPVADVAADLAGVPRQLVRNQIKTESNWNPNAVSGSNAQGIMQIIPKWHPGVDPFNPIDAIRYGVALDAASYKKRGSWKLALMDYNWGPGNVDKWIADGSIDSQIQQQTQNYLTKILGPGWSEPTTVVVNPGSQFNVGPGIVALMTQNNDVPATDELYFKNASGTNMVSSAWGKSGARYDYIFSTNETHRFPQG